MPEWVFWIAGALMSLGALAAVVRMFAGPTILDRIVASDMLVSVLAAVVALFMMGANQPEYAIILLCISLVAFVGTVGVARFVQSRQETGVYEGEPEDGRVDIGRERQDDAEGEADDTLAGEA